MTSFGSMRSRGVLISLTLAAALGGGGCDRAKPEDGAAAPSASSVAQQAEAAASAAPSSAASEAPAAEPEVDPSENWIEVSEELMVPVVDELGQKLLAASKALEAKQPDVAAQQLRAASATLAEQSEELPTAAKAEVTKTVKGLNETAAKVQKGELESAAVLKVIHEAYRTDVDQRWLFVGVDEWFRYYKRPAGHFKRARAAVGKDAKLAALEVRKANSYIELTAARAHGLARDVLADQVKSLEALAVGLASGAITDPAAVDDAAVASSQALSEAHYQDAVEAWEKKDHELSARSLEASIHHLEQSLAGADLKLAADVGAALKTAREFAATVKKDTKVEEAAMKQHFKAVEGAIAELKAKLKSKNKPATE